MNIVFGIIFAGIGILVVVLEIKKQLNCTEVTKGKVVDISREIEENKNYDSSAMSMQTERKVVFYPVYEYTVGGNKITAKSDKNVNGAFIGQIVDIHYNPDKPNEFYAGKVVNIIQIISGLIFVIVGIAIMFGKI